MDLFRDTGIGREGYSIIGQGRIADMLSHKPEERRDVFHEAAGIMKYRARRDEAQRRLDSTRVNIQRLSDIMEEMERQLGPLKRQSQNARRYLEISEKLKELDLNLFLVEYDKLKSDEQKIIEEIDKLIGLAEQEEGSNDENAQKAEEMADSIEAQEKEVDRLRYDIETLGERINFFAGQQLVMKERLTYAQMEQKRLLEEIEMDENRVEELTREAHDLKEALDGNNGSTQNVKQDLEDIKARIAKIDEDIKMRQADIDAKKTDMMSGLQMMADIGSSSGRLEAMIESYTARQEEMRESLEAAARQKEINDDIGRELHEAVSNLSVEIERLKAETDKNAQTRNELRVKRSELEQNLQSKHDKVRNAQTRIQLLDTLIKDYEGFSNTVKFMLGDSRAQKLVTGVVADIIEVPADYVGGY